ncbi:unnamed protein product, partial [Sphacelaria rigidula]
KPRATVASPLPLGLLSGNHQNSTTRSVSSVSCSASARTASVDRTVPERHSVGVGSHNSKNQAKQPAAATEAENIIPQTQTTTVARPGAAAGVAGVQSRREAHMAAVGRVDHSVGGAGAGAAERSHGRKTSRKSRRRSIVMPSEAKNSLFDDEEGRDDASNRPPADGAPATDDPAIVATRGVVSAGSTTGEATGDHARTSASSSNSTSSRKNSSVGTPADGGDGKPPAMAPASATSTVVNATSCLVRPLAAQRGWKGRPGDDTKTLMRAYYAERRGSQRARLVAARLFCVTGYCLLP